MTWKALTPANLNTVKGPGMCLPFAQSFFDAPVRYDSAWQSWEATQFKHGPEEPTPDVPVLLWYSHYGTYYSYSKQRYEYGNWGHVTPLVPGKGIYSSPSTPVGGVWGQEIYNTTQQIEQVFGAKYVGWSEDINGKRIAEFTESIESILEATMSNPIISVPDSQGTLFIGTDDGDFVQYATPTAMNSRGIISVVYFGAPGGDTDTIPSLSWGDFAVARTVWKQMCTGSGVIATVDTEAIAKAVTDAIETQGVSVDVEGIAKAVESALADEFAAIPANTVEELKERL